MAASVIRTRSDFALARPLQACFTSEEDEEETEEEYEEELRQEVEDSLEEEEDVASIVSHEEELWSFDNSEMTNQLLRFAELISNDVQRYFGRSQDPDACDIYAETPCPKVGGRQRYYADFIKVASSSGQGEEPESLGPLAELFKDAQRKGRGLPMSQRRLPISFWTEPLSHHLNVLSDANMLENSFGMTNTSESSINMSMYSNMTSSCIPGTLSSSSTPDFSDLLAHWGIDKDTNEFNCDFHLL